MWCLFPWRPLVSVASEEEAKQKFYFFSRPRGWKHFALMLFIILVCLEKLRPGWTELSFVCFLSFLFKAIYKESPPEKFSLSPSTLHPHPGLFLDYVKREGKVIIQRAASALVHKANQIRSHPCLMPSVALHCYQDTDPALWCGFHGPAG